MECHIWSDAPTRYHEIFLTEELSPKIKFLHPKDIYSNLNRYLSLTGKEWEASGDVYDGDIYCLY